MLAGRPRSVLQGLGEAPVRPCGNRASSWARPSGRCVYGHDLPKPGPVSHQRSVLHKGLESARRRRPRVPRGPAVPRTHCHRGVTGKHSLHHASTQGGDQRRDSREPSRYWAPPRLRQGLSCSVEWRRLGLRPPARRVHGALPGPLLLPRGPGSRGPAWRARPACALHGPLPGDCSAHVMVPPVTTGSRDTGPWACVPDTGHSFAPPETSFSSTLL